MNIAIKRLKLGVVSFGIALMGLLVVALPASAQIPDSSKDAACQGLGVTGQGCDGTAGTSVSDLLSTAVEILSWVLGAVAVIMIIIAGFKFVTANGDSNSISSARSTIIYALVGLAVAALAQLLVNFVLDKTTMTDVYYAVTELTGNLS